MLIIQSPPPQRPRTTQSVAARDPAPAPAKAAVLDEASEKILARARKPDAGPAEPISKIVQLFRIEDPRVRSRVALLVGQYTSYTTFLQNRLEEQDDRVRANVIESLWGSRSEQVRTVFKNVLNDSYHRVRGNALLGLYRMGDPSAPPALAELSSHRLPLFRAAAAWVMGETKDLQFVELLTGMGEDDDESVRRNAFKALLKMNEHLMAQPDPPPAPIAASEDE